MSDKVRLRICILPCGEVHEFCVPLCLRVEQVIPLLIRLLRACSSSAVYLREDSMLMLLDGQDAGKVLGEQVLVEDFVRWDVITDGSMLAMV